MCKAKPNQFKNALIPQSPEYKEILLKWFLTKTSFHFVRYVAEYVGPTETNEPYFIVNFDHEEKRNDFLDFCIANERPPLQRFTGQIMIRNRSDQSVVYCKDYPTEVAAQNEFNNIIGVMPDLSISEWPQSHKIYEIMLWAISIKQPFVSFNRRSLYLDKNPFNPNP